VGRSWRFARTLMLRPIRPSNVAPIGRAYTAPRGYVPDASLERGRAATARPIVGTFCFFAVLRGPWRGVAVWQIHINHGHH
jgi:hypothetical protein